MLYRRTSIACTGDRGGRRRTRTSGAIRSLTSCVRTDGSSMGPAGRRRPSKRGLPERIPSYRQTIPSRVEPGAAGHGRGAPRTLRLGLSALDLELPEALPGVTPRANQASFHPRISGCSTCAQGGIGRTCFGPRTIRCERECGAPPVSGRGSRNRGRGPCGAPSAGAGSGLRAIPSHRHRDEGAGRAAFAGMTVSHSTTSFPKKRIRHRDFDPSAGPSQGHVDAGWRDRLFCSRQELEGDEGISLSGSTLRGSLREMAGRRA